MRKLKKLGVCLCMAVIGATIMAVPAYAKGNNSRYHKESRNTYTEPEVVLKYQYTSSHGNAYYQESRVTNPEKMYKDETIRKYAEESIEKGYYVGDLKTLNRYGLECGLSVNNDRVFNTGIAIYDEGDYYDDTSFATYVCKCSDRDYEELYDYYNDKIIEQNGRYEFVTKDSKTECTFTYNPETNILIAHTQYE